MLTSSSTMFLALVLLTGASATEQPLLPDCAATPHRIELSAGSSLEVPEVCISPDLPTTLRFDSPLPPGAVQLQDRERFEDVATGMRSITLVPPKDLQPGERFKVEVRFADGAAPESATLVLVGHPARAARQVELFRHRRTLEDYQQEVNEKETRIQQLQAELQRMRTEGLGQGITGLLSGGLMRVGKEYVQGVLAKDLTRTLTTPPAPSFHSNTIISYRSTTVRDEEGGAVMRVAVAIELENLGSEPWLAKDAVLRVGKGKDVKELKVWQLAPIAPGASGLVVVETELGASEARGTFTLQLWDEHGGRRVTLGGVTFP